MVWFMLFFALSALVYVLYGVYQNQQSALRLKSSGALPMPGRDFGAYVLGSREWLQSVVSDLPEGWEKNNWLDVVSPFVMHPTQLSGEKPKLGFLLMHGINETPGKMKSFAQQLRNTYPEAYIIGSLMSGHGSLPADMLNANHEQWITMCHQSVDWLANQVDQVILVGFSTGGALAVHHAATHLILKGCLILLAPAIHVQLPFYASKFLKHICPFVSVLPQKSPFSYGAITYHSASEVLQLSEKIPKDKKLDIPVMCILSEADEAIDVGKTKEYFHRNCSHQSSKCVIYGHHQQADIDDSRIDYMHNQELLAKYQTLDVAHIAMVIPPTDPYFGYLGQGPDFRLYVSLGLSTPKDTPKDQWVYGSASSFYHKRYHQAYAIGSFNPYFKETFRELRMFCDGLVSEQTAPDASLVNPL